jgi:hypothetical protein
MLADDHDPSVKVANLSTYILSEFYMYELHINGSEIYTWYDAVPCVQYYEEIYGSFDAIPKSLQRELIGIHNTPWMCPNMPITGDEQYLLQNDPWQYNFGTNLNYVVNFCWVSA